MSPLQKLQMNAGDSEWTLQKNPLDQRQTVHDIEYKIKLVKPLPFLLVIFNWFSLAIAVYEKNKLNGKHRFLRGRL